MAKEQIASRVVEPARRARNSLGLSDYNLVGNIYRWPTIGRLLSSHSPPITIIWALYICHRPRLAVRNLIPV